MGKSVSKPVMEGVSNRRFRHALSGSSLSVELRSGVLTHSIERQGKRYEYRPVWAVGSGNQCKGFCCINDQA